MNNNSYEVVIQQGNIMQINNAFVESVSCFNNSNGYILISYYMPETNNINSIQNIRLNLNRNTIVLNPSGENTCLCCIEKGMWVNVTFSSRMTMSIPPQSNAFLIAIQRTPRPSFSITTGRIILIDFDNNYFITEDLNNINNQTRFIISNTTSFTDCFGNPIRFENLIPGEIVRINHANFQTPSIPPQTSAFNVQLI